MTPAMNESVAPVFGDAPLRIEDVVALARRQVPAVLSTDPAFRARIAKGADFLSRLLEEEGVIYGVTTGYGDSCTVNIPPALVAELPHHLYTYHGCGLGRFLDPAETRAVLAALDGHLTRFGLDRTRGRGQGGAVVAQDGELIRGAVAGAATLLGHAGPDTGSGDGLPAVDHHAGELLLAQVALALSDEVGIDIGLIDVLAADRGVDRGDLRPLAQVPGQALNDGVRLRQGRAGQVAFHLLGPLAAGG